MGEWQPWILQGQLFWTSCSVLVATFETAYGITLIQSGTRAKQDSVSAHSASSVMLYNCVYRFVMDSDIG